jgi:predicted PurR-regulated permease PerM
MSETTPDTPATGSGSRLLLTLAAVVVVIAGLKASGSVLLPILVAVFLAIIAAPAINWLQRHRFPDWAAVVTVFAVVLMLFVGVSTVVGTAVADFSRNLPTYEQKLDGYSTSVATWLTEHRIISAEWGKDISDASTSSADEGVASPDSNLTTSPDPATTQGEGGVWSELVNTDSTSNGHATKPAKSLLDVIDPSSLLKVFSTALSALANMLSNAVFVLLTVVFILAEAAGLPAKLRLAMGNATADLTKFTHVVTDLKGYLVVKTQLSLLTGVSIWLPLQIIGLDYALLWGLLAFLLNYIPTLGSFIIAVPAVLLALIQLGWIWALVVAGIFLIVNSIIGNFLEPKMFGRRLGLSSLVIFLSLVFWGWIWGPVGMVLSIPLTMLVKILLEHSDDLKWLAILMGSGAERKARST